MWHIGDRHGYKNRESRLQDNSLPNCVRTGGLDTDSVAGVLGLSEDWKMSLMFKRFADELQWRCASLAARMTDRDPVSGIRMTRRLDLVSLGSASARWIVPAHVLHKGSICYCAGVGYELSFELELIRRFWCRVFGFDPSPRAKNFVSRIGAEAVGFDFHGLALGDQDGTKQFANSADQTYISTPSTANSDLHRTDKHYESLCRRVSTLMKELGHQHLALLKLDLDSGTHEVVAKFLADGVRPGILCLSFAGGADSERANISKTLRSLVETDEYALVASDGLQRFTLIHES